MDTEGNGMTWKLYEADCFDVFPSIEDKSIDMILCDLPYGTTACKWDTPLPLDKLWTEYKRVIKDNGAIVLTASQPFTSQLVMSNPQLYRHSWVWNKKFAGNFAIAKFAPMKINEDILVFGLNSVNYYPQMTKRNIPIVNGANKCGSESAKFSHNSRIDGFKKVYTHKYPESILLYPRERGLHPTQKPVALFEYLIKTYTNEHDVVLDNCAGSGTTGVACQNLNRDCILIEKEAEYCQIIRERMQTVETLQVEARKQKTLTDFMPAK